MSGGRDQGPEGEVRSHIVAAHGSEPNQVPGRGHQAEGGEHPLAPERLCGGGLRERNKEEIVSAKSPMTKEMSDEADQDLATMITTYHNDAMKAQRVTGELLWLMTRTRPDLLFGMSRLRMTARSPKRVARASGKMLGYLKQTKVWGIKITKTPTLVGPMASSPTGFLGCVIRTCRGEKSGLLGGVFGTHGGGVESWKAVCELIGAIDGVILGDSVEAPITDALGTNGYAKMLLSGNVAAVALEAEWAMRHWTGHVGGPGHKAPGPTKDEHNRKVSHN